MAITLARIDDRVIHGQTVTRWAASRPCNAILVISDKVAADELRKKVLKAAAGALKLGIYTVEQGVAALEKAKSSPKSFFIISDSVEEFANLKRKGGDFGDVLNVGNLSGTREGTKKPRTRCLHNGRGCFGFRLSRIPGCEAAVSDDARGRCEDLG